MKIIINNSSVQPIYEQIVNQIKAMITDGTLKIDTMLPSVRSLAQELKISALTVKKSLRHFGTKRFCCNCSRKGKLCSRRKSADPVGRTEKRGGSSDGNGRPKGQKLLYE